MFAAGAGVFAALGTAMDQRALLLYSASLDRASVTSLAGSARDRPGPADRPDLPHGPCPRRSRRAVAVRRYWLAAVGCSPASWTTLVGSAACSAPGFRRIPAGRRGRRRPGRDARLAARRGSAGAGRADRPDRGHGRLRYPVVSGWSPGSWPASWPALCSTRVPRAYPVVIVAVLLAAGAVSVGFPGRADHPAARARLLASARRLLDHAAPRPSPRWRGGDRSDTSSGFARSARTGFRRSARFFRARRPPESRGPQVVSTVAVIVRAHFGGDREARGNREPEGRISCRFAPLPPRKLLHPPIAFGLSIAEKIDLLRTHFKTPGMLKPRPASC